MTARSKDGCNLTKGRQVDVTAVVEKSTTKDRRFIKDLNMTAVRAPARLAEVLNTSQVPQMCD